MNKIYSLILILLIVILAISSYFFIKEIAENKKENELFEELQEVVQEEEKTTAQNQITDNLKNETSNLSSKNVGNYNLESISKINTDIIGWIKIDGTNINYPVMQNGDFYLHRNVYKNYSSSGTPYLAEHCNLKTSDNLIIYGHHMKNNTMFSNLDNYKNYNYYKNHKYIKFYTLEDNKIYLFELNLISYDAFNSLNDVYVTFWRVKKEDGNKTTYNKQNVLNPSINANATVITDKSNQFTITLNCSELINVKAFSSLKIIELA